MRSKSPLVLMEQLVMVLVFALAATLCLQVFVASDRVSRHHAAVDRAVLECQTAAETLKGCGGDMAHAQSGAAELLGGTVSQGLLSVLYDEDWQRVEDTAGSAYVLHAQGVPAGVDGLCKAMVWVDAVKDISVGGDYDGPLFELTVAWQEVGGNG